MLRFVRTSALAIAVAACSAGSAQQAASADSLAKSDSAAAVNLALTKSSVAANLSPSERAAAAPRARSKRSTPASSPATEPSAARSLAAGTRIDATMQDALSSRTNHSGDAVHAVVGAAVLDSRGRVVIPAGSRVTLTVDHIDPGSDQSQPDGRLSLVVSSVSIDGQSFPISARLDPVAHQMVGRGITKDEAARIAAGTAIGAVAGQIIGKNTKSTVVGGAAGAVVGTAVAVRYAYRDVVVPTGTPITFTLTDGLVTAK